MKHIMGGVIAWSFPVWSRPLASSPSPGQALAVFTSSSHPHCHGPDEGRKEIDKCMLLLVLTLSWIQVPRPLSSA